MSESQDRACMFCRNLVPSNDGWHRWPEGGDSALYRCGNNPKHLIDWWDIEMQLRKDFEVSLDERKKRWFDAPKPPIMNIAERDLKKESRDEWLDKGTYDGADRIKKRRGLDS